MEKDSPVFFLIAGEVSGDRHGADLIKELRKLYPEARFKGIGGDKLKAAGMELLYHNSRLAFLGITEVVKHLPFIRRVMKDVKEELRKGVDAVILIDYPGFNLKIAPYAKKLGIPVIYYICPQLWAWGEKRVEKIRRYVDLPLVIFKFEELFYAQHGIEAEFVGHPLTEQIHITVGKEAFFRKHQLPIEKPLVGLFPGSREMEIRKILPVMLQAVEMYQKKQDITIAIGAASHIPTSLYQEFLSGNSDVPLISGDEVHALMKYSHVGLVSSGTATLEMGYLQTPMVVLYSVSPITYWIGKRLVKIDTIALANIVIGEKVVPELIQGAMTAEKVLFELERYFQNPTYYNSVKERLSDIQKELGPPGAASRAAARIASFLNQHPPQEI
ncbi:MAG: lipid-A-disaccharide synthase [Calditrichaeota bacterium]|nr:MAG: lipid-A-disaccharide synthase [Calditrichota bacterium]